jgi:hypothetical protein
MKNAALLVAACAGVIVLAADDPQPKSLSFKDAKVGELPSGWTAATTGKGTGSVWKIVEDPSAPGGTRVLAQTAKGPSPLFNLCIADDVRHADLDFQAAFKPLTGEIDQGGGLLWRLKDANNYYVARYNPLEDNLRVYKVVDGKRTQLASANPENETPAGKWHAIRVVHKGNHIQCYLNGKKYLDVKDDAFKDAGKIGLWTKADAQTYFADLKVSGK